MKENKTFYSDLICKERSDVRAGQSNGIRKSRKSPRALLTTNFEYKMINVFLC